MGMAFRPAGKQDRKKPETGNIWFMLLSASAVYSVRPDECRCRSWSS